MLKNYLKIGFRNMKRHTMFSVVFLLSGLGVLFISIVTVIVQTIKAAQANPADIIKYE